MTSHREASTRLPDGWTVGRVARVTGMHPITVARALSGETDPRVSTLQTIARTVGLAVTDLWPDLGQASQADS